MPLFVSVCSCSLIDIQLQIKFFICLQHCRSNSILSGTEGICGFLLFFSQLDGGGFVTELSLISSFVLYLIFLSRLNAIHATT